MDGSFDAGGRPFRGAIQKWQHVGGAIGRDGVRVAEPWPLAKAKLIDRMCQRYSCLPSQVLAEDAYIIQMLNILAIAGELGEPGQEGNNATNGTGGIEASLANTSF